MRRGSRLLDRGREIMTVWPATSQTDNYGNTQWFPSQDSNDRFTLRVNVSTDRQMTAELPGQLDVKVLKVSFRGYPIGEPNSYDRIELRGEEWDLAVPPVRSQLGRSTSHWFFILRSRSLSSG